MELSRYVEELRQQLLVAAEGSGEEAQAVADRLVAPLESSTRLVLLDALSAAADEITTDLAPGSVDVRLRGRDPEFVVTQPPTAPEPGDVVEPPPDIPAAPPAGGDADEGGTSRITLRLPEQLKNQIEHAAGREGISVNAWLVRTTAAAVNPRAGEPPPGSRRAPSSGQHLTGWVR